MNIAACHQPKQKLEVDLRHCGRHLENRREVITRPPTQNHMPMTTETQSGNRK